MADEIEFKMSDRRRLACLDVKGPYEQVIPAGFGRLFGWAGPKGYVAGPPMGLYHDSPDDVAPEELRSTVAVPVTEGAQGEGEIRIEVIEPREEAVFLYKGPYTDMGKAYGTVFDAIFKGGYRIAGSPMDVYLNDPDEVPPEELVTEIHIPVERA